MNNNGYGDGFGTGDGDGAGYGTGDRDGCGIGDGDGNAGWGRLIPAVTQVTTSGSSLERALVFIKLTKGRFV